VPVLSWFCAWKKVLAAYQAYVLEGSGFTTKPLPVPAEQSLRNAKGSRPGARLITVEVED